MRKSIIAGNWKMNTSVDEAVRLGGEVERACAGLDAVEIVLCPPFISLDVVGRALRDGTLKLGAQNVHWEPDGAHTGEISAKMLRDLGCDYVIVGHSERRMNLGETDERINRKIHAVLEQDMRPILCVGETWEQREAGRTESVVREQVERAIAGLEGSLDGTVIAYEPVWAIGTGRSATTEQAQDAHALIRGLIRRLSGPAVADAMRIQYGGSVKPANAKELFAQPDVDGGLIGGASLVADSFQQIVTAAS